MNVLNRDEVNLKRAFVLRNIENGHVFLYPTDTIYGIGCDATNEDSVKRIRRIKQRKDSPFSVIVPSKQWINDNCIITGKAEEWMRKLPGPYTLILILKKKGEIAPSVNPGNRTIGVRIPDHWISGIVSDLKRPLITTSPNKEGKDIMTSLENFDTEIRKELDFIIYEGEITGRPSTIVNLESGVPSIRER